jgi:indolepyruvate decarboxylase
MFADKSVLDEQHPSYIGMYDGKLMNEDVRAFVESCDQVLCVGTMMTDLNSGAFTAGLQSARTIEIGHHRTRVGSHVFSNIEMHDMLAELPRRAIRCSMTCSLHAGSLGHIVRDGDDPISADALYSRWEKFFQPGDTIIAETGTASMGLAFAHLPRGATFHNQTIWGSVGWATPASFDAAVAIRRHSHVLGCQDWYTARVTTCAELDGG